MTKLHQRPSTGKRGEEAVACHLAGEGFRILARNVRVGRLELDIIAARGSLLVVCEVRARTTTRFGEPVATIDRAKAERIRRATAIWVRANGARPRRIRFDAASVILSPQGARIRYYRDAF